MESVPYEVICDILSRVFGEDLNSCKLVCRGWHEVIKNDSYFRKIHLLRNPSETLIVLRNHECQKTEFLITPADAREPLELISWEYQHLGVDEIKVEGICNGLILLSGFSHSQDDISCLLWLWNPLVGDSIKVPCPFGSNIADNYELGFDTLCNHYKVLRISYIDQYPHFSIKTVGTNFLSWRKVEGIRYTLQSSKTIVNGNVHWMVETITPTYQQTLYAFNMQREKFHVIPHPPGICYGQLARMGEFLAIFRPSAVQNTIWVMREYGVSTTWTKMYTFAIPLVCQLRELLSLTSDSEIIFRNGRYYIQYSPRKMTTVVTTFGLEPWDVPYFYKGSLVSPEEAGSIIGSDHVGYQLQSHSRRGHLSRARDGVVSC